MPRHSTFGKLQRERDKRAKAVAKQERRAAMQAEAGEAPGPEALDAEAEQRLLNELAELHQSYEAGLVSLDDFETRRDQLRARLQVG